MSLLWTKRVACPICGEEFTTYNVHLNKISLVKLENDLYPVYKNLNPLFFSLYTCPKCKYSAFPDDFQNFNDLKKDYKDKIITEVKKFDKIEIDLSENRTLEDAIKIHGLAFLIYDSYTKDILTLAELTLKLGWLNRIKKDKKNEVYFKLKTLEYLETAFDNGKTNPKFSEIKMMYLIGEINYEFKRYKKAKQWLGRLIEYSYKNKTNPIVAMAKNILEEIKNEK
jgi:uncharacterized protein (DUF2225 family)